MIKTNTSSGIVELTPIASVLASQGTVSNRSEATFRLGQIGKLVVSVRPQLATVVQGLNRTNHDSRATTPEGCRRTGRAERLGSRVRLVAARDGARVWIDGQATVALLIPLLRGQGALSRLAGQRGASKHGCVRRSKSQQLGPNDPGNRRSHVRASIPWSDHSVVVRQSLKELRADECEDDGPPSGRRPVRD
jgi:hypothetical protein